jgi:hypothetical protein
LSWLAKRDNPAGENLLGVIVPHTTNQVVSISKGRVFTTAHSAQGHQFERLVTGKRFTDAHDMASVEHLHVVGVKQYKILFCAEVDAISSQGSPVEVTVSNWIHNKLFQMISNGSSTLCFGTRDQTCLSQVQIISLSSLVASQQSMINSWIQNIVQGLDLLKSAKDQFAPGEAFEITYDGDGKPTLAPKAGADLLPPEKVIKGLL